MSYVSEIHPDRILEMVLDALRELVDYELAVVLGLEEDGRLVVRKAAGPLADRRFLEFSLDLSDRPDIDRILKAGKPHLFDTETAFIDVYATLIDLPAGHSCLVLPLAMEGESFGLLTLDHRECGRFTPRIVSFISAISRLISVSIRQADTAQDLSRRVRERNALPEPLASLVGSCPAWRRVLDEVRLVAPTEAEVLLLGETGTGKDEVAQAIHRLSPRSEKSFVAVNCSALSSGLAESELFGHERGSFTGSVGLRKGRFELADGGTLFLDEIADLPADIQPKLLRALQTGRFERLGGEQTIETKIRVIAATNRNMEQEVAAGRFREDLYYRLAVFPLRLPPLREREGDVLLLAEHFLARLRRDLAMPGLRFSAAALEEISTRPWRGNARELRNALNRAAILAQGGLIGADLLRDRVDSLRSGAAVSAAASSWDDGLRELIDNALRLSGGKLRGPGGAAEILGVKATTLQSRMVKLGIRRP